MSVLQLVAVLLVVSIASPALSYPTGAPQEACMTATPNHPTALAPQTSTNPYSIDLSVFDDGSGSYSYLPRRTYQLTLSAAGNTTSPTFRGFFIQGRLAADDSPNVGTFESPLTGAVARLSSCGINSNAITHNSRSDKDSVTVSWTSPYTGTGAVTFAYAVVQTLNTFWANDRTSAIQEESDCEVPFYETNGHCVETCPPNEFGSNTTTQCEPYPANFALSLNATTYVAEITVDTPFGTPVLFLGTVINSSTFTNMVAVLFSFVGNSQLVERIFKFSNGDIDEVQQIPSIPDTSNNIILMSQIQYVDDPRDTTPGSDSVALPATYEINIMITANPPTTSASVRAFVTVNPPPVPCQPDPCLNRGTCNVLNTTSSTCTCPPDFTDTNCETQIDDCMEVDCRNGTCVDGVESFECTCIPGFTGSFCETNFDDCTVIACANGVCLDLINAIECDCYPGWTGAYCEIDIDYCESQPLGPCSTTGSVGCSDGNTTFTCNCVVGFTGINCSQDIDECESIRAATGESACFNGGNCTNQLFGRFECDCPSDYCGERCEIDLTPCIPDPCENSGTCQQNGVDFMCICPPGYTDLNCSMEVNECMSDPCGNGGTCADIVNGFICQCPMGYSGAMCDVDEDFCAPETCQNDGTCIEGPGTDTTCVCAEGFSGFNCSVDLSFCTVRACMNGGTCIEGAGTIITCECPSGFTGANCSDELEFCTEDTCLNGGTCNEGSGTITTCECAAGFTGANCSVDLDFCTEDTCLNGGTCNEGSGTITTCECAAGFTGTNCTIDLAFCEVDTCLNGGTCLEDIGTLTWCECATGYTGVICDEDERNFTACEPTTCMNGGTCAEEFGPDTSCSCLEGYSGPYCGTDLPFCDTNTCLNGGTCNEGPGTATVCDCAAGFSGTNCSEDLEFCTASTCLNDGTCSEGPGIETTCYCNVGFSGSNCSVDLDFCMSGTCGNGGTCIEEQGNRTNCSCSEGFTGVACDIDLPFCEAETCLNGGTCFEGSGTETTCECVSGFSGVSCETDLSFCQPGSCLNGGTCLEEVGTLTRCECPPDFTGSDCATLSEPCETSLYYYNGECTAVCPDGYYGNHTSFLCTPFPEDYRTILNATSYTASVIAADSYLGTPIVRFTVFINNTYFQIPQAVIFQIETNGNASFVFEDGEGSDVLIIDASDPNFDPATVPILKISRQIVGTQSVQAGEYEGELTVIVVAREGTEITPVEWTSEMQITITTGATDVTPTEDRGPTMNLSLVWITAGAVALAIVVAVFSTICFCGVGRRRKHIFDTGRRNQRPKCAQANWKMAPSTEHGRMLLEETDINTQSINAAAASDHEEPPVFATTAFTTPEFSVVIENSPPEHSGKREAASQATALEVLGPVSGQPLLQEHNTTT